MEEASGSLGRFPFDQIFRFEMDVLGVLDG